MKKFFVSSILVCFYLFNNCVLLADPVNMQQAKTMVSGWLKANPVRLGKAMSSNIDGVTRFNTSNGDFFVVHLAPKGYVVVPADNELEPIIAFSATGKYDNSRKKPTGTLINQDVNGRFKCLSKIRNAESKGLRLNPKMLAITSKFSKNQKKWRNFSLASMGQYKLRNRADSISDTRVSPILNTRWSQSEAGSKACYNYYTPTGTGIWDEGDMDNYPCGCVATAMAQVMRHYEYPTQSVGTTSFTVTVNDQSETRQLLGGDETGGPYEWIRMPLFPSGGETADELRMIGTICHDAGISVKMDYTADGSGAYMDDATAALKNTFYFSQAFYGGVTQNSYVPASNILNPNLDAGHPLLLGITDWIFGGGHAIVCDGYGFDSNTIYHHLNMGWAGSDDAWYALPSILDFTTVDEVIFNVFTDFTGEIISGRVTEEGTNVALSGITITANDLTASTDSKGIYYFEGLDSATTYTITCIKSGESQTVTTGTSATTALGATPQCGNVWGVNFAIATQPIIATDETELTPASAMGHDATSNSFQVWNAGTDVLNYSISSGAAWMTCSPSTGSSTGSSDRETITVTYSTAALSEGIYTGVITITDSNAANSPYEITVTLSIVNKPMIMTSENDFEIECDFGEAKSGITFQVWNLVTGTSMNYQISTNANWLSVSPKSGESSGPNEKDTIQLSIDSSNLSIGSYEATITITSLSAFNSPKTIPVTLEVGPAQYVETDGLIAAFEEGVGNLTRDNKDRVQFWLDASGNQNNASQLKSNRRPIVINSLLGERVLSFNGRQYLSVPTHPEIDSKGPYTEKSVFLAFRTGSDVTRKQVLFEQGDKIRGMNIHIDSGMLYFSAWNLADDAGKDTSWGPVSAFGNISAETYHRATLIFDQTGAGLSCYIDGVPLASATVPGKLYSSDEGMAIGGVNKTTLLHDGSNGKYGFIGELCCLFYYNTALSNTSRENLETYLSTKYDDNFTAADDFVLWLESENGVIYDSDNRVISWTGSSYRRIELKSKGKNGRPLFEKNAVGNQGALIFDGRDDVMKSRNDKLINGASSGKTLFLAFETGTDINSRQVVWAQGNKKCGLNVYIYNSQIYCTVWNLKGKNGGRTWGPLTLSTDITISTVYITSLSIDSTNYAFEASIQNVTTETPVSSMGKASGAGALDKHSPGALGAAIKPIVFTSDFIEKGFHFKGSFLELIMYNEVLSSDISSKVFSKLSGKY